MKIPIGVSHRVFWEEAKKKGVKISSKYTGVYLNINSNGSPSWMARVQEKDNKSYKRFEFTEDGEIEASKYYIRHKKDQP